MPRTECRYGKHCWRLDDDHWQNCEKLLPVVCVYKVYLFHGTRCSSADSILAHGLNPSTEGRLGPGIYLTTRKAARWVAEHRGNGEMWCVFEVEVDLGHEKVLDGEQDDKRGTWRHEGFHSCRTTHPTWDNVTPKPFPEWCVCNAANCKIVGMVQSGHIVRPGFVHNFNKQIAVASN
ncbi:unnamed protein product [Rotaria magnacalcarata]|uniref:PARP catalytic domain-containing protein n=1 Tax=Rotaria magnacalcarata TaxID=392030 RepID=A0A8S3DJM6_9BILA|nr:unnamed protein product [Rotaria magnacalcarata]